VDTSSTGDEQLAHRLSPFHLTATQVVSLDDFLRTIGIETGPTR
jgi:hypothetical protein